MQFPIIYLVSLLLVPSLVASKRFEPPSPTPSHPDHGDIVSFQAPSGQHLGVVVGSQQHQGGNVNVAPLAHNSPLPPHTIVAHSDHVVNTHPGNVARTSYLAPGLASNLQTHHRNSPPDLRWASGPVAGSPNHRPAQPIGGRGGYRRPVGVRGHRRR